MKRSLPFAPVLAVITVACGFPQFAYETSADDAAVTVDASSVDGGGSPDASGALDATPVEAPAGDTRPSPEGGDEKNPCDEDGDGYELANCGTLVPDCCDTDINAHPGQTLYFGSKDACGSFDYDCDGSETPKWGAYLYCEPVTVGLAVDCVALCPSSQCACAGAACSYGYVGPDPGCGDAGAFATCQPGDSPCQLETTSTDQPQTCR